MKQHIKAGFTDYSTLIFIPDSASTDGSGKTGLVAANLTVSGVRVETDNDVTVTDYTSSLNNLASLTAAHNDWGLLEVSSTLAPGLYRLDIADAIFAAGAWTAVVYVMVTTSAAAASPMEFVLVGYDQHDGVRLGLTALPNAAANAAGGLVISAAGGLDADAQRADVAAILVDTGTTLDGRLPAALGANGNMKADVRDLLGTAWLAPGTAGTPDVNVKLWNALTTVALPLVPTTAGRTLDVSAGGEAGVDWANVGSPTTTLALTGTTVATTQKVDVETIKTQAVTAAAGVTFPTSIASPTNITAGTITTATNLTTNNDKTGYGLSSAAVQAIWDALTSALTTVGSIGKKLADWTIGTAQTGDAFARLGAPAGASVSADLALLQADTDDIQTRLPAALVSGRMDSSTGAMAANVLTATAIAADAITDAKVASDVTIASVTGAVGSVTGAVGSVTGNVGGNVVGSVASVVGAVGSVTGNVGGNVTGSVGSVATGGIVRASLAADTGLQSIRSNTAQAGASTTITLDASASAVTDFYKNALIVLTGGTGAGQGRYCTAYNGTTKVATVTAWATNPDNTTTFAVIAADAIVGATAPTASQVADEVQTRTIAAVTTVNGLAANTVTAAALAADAGTEIGTAVWATTTRLLTAGTNIALAKGTGVTGFTDIDAAGVRTAVGLAAANLDTQLTTIDDFLDTEVAAIKAKTDALPSDPADASDVAAAVAAVKLYADRTVVRGTVSATSPTTTTFTSSALSPVGVAADQFKGRIIVFDNDTTTTALRGQATDITASSAASNPLFTFTALTTAPQSSDTFSIL